MTALAQTAGMLAAGFAGLSGGIAAMAVFDGFRRFTHASSVLGDSKRSHVLLQLQKGIPALDGISRLMIARVPLADEAAERICNRLYERDIVFAKETIVSLTIGAAVMVGCAGWLVTGSFWFAISISLTCILAFMLAVKNRGERQDAAMREQIPEVIRSIETSFRSGHSLPQTLATSSKECAGELRSLFAKSADRLELGASTTEALEVMRGNPRIPELAFIAVALDIQHQSGGSIGPVLASAMETVEGELKLMRNLRIQTAQARLSAAIVTVMPFILVALFSAMSPDFLSPFFSSIAGMAMLAVALCMQLAGVLLVRRMLKVEV